MTADVEGLEAAEKYLSALMAALSPAERRKLMRKIGMLMRQKNRQRIAANTAPDGAPFAPRKPRLRAKRGRVKRMFAGLKKAANLRITASSEGASLAFAGKVSRVAQVHHFGLRDKVDRKMPKSPFYQYPARPLLGWGPEDLEAVTELVLRHLTVRP
jgi:phage virion morphogenesis protein